MANASQDCAPGGLEGLLEIWIPTFNRSSKLANILKDLAESELSQCVISISDNASTDDTRAVCAEFVQKLPNMTYRTLPFNIGANPNILDGFRTVTAPYFWIVCDDDHLCLDAFREQFLAFAEQNVDLMLLPCQFNASHEGEGLMALHGGKTAPLKEVVRSVPDLVRTMTFLPSVIYSRRLLSSEVLYWGYNNSVFMYPHMPLISAAINANVTTAVFNNTVVQGGVEVQPCSAPLRLCLALCHSCRFITDPGFRTLARWSVLGGASFKSWKIVVRNLLLWRLVCPDEPLQTVAPLSALPSSIFWAYCFGVVACAPLMLVPRSVIISVLKALFPPEKLWFLGKAREFAS